MLECVVNVSEGRQAQVVRAIAAAAGDCLLDTHTDADHHRSVLTLGGPDDAVEEAARGVAAEAVVRIDLRDHVGVHPRLGAVDVVPFVPLAATSLSTAVAARDGFASWAATTLHLPCFLYSPERPLPEVRAQAFTGVMPDLGPPVPHPTAGATCVGARPVLVAYNLWLSPEADMELARAIARGLRGDAVRALAMDLGGEVQVSLNLIEPLRFGPADAYDEVAARAPVTRAELVGLVPAAVLDGIPQHRWAELDLDPARTIEARLRAAGV